MRRPDDLARTGFDFAPDATVVLSDRVILSAEARGMPAELKAGPPMDIEIVRKIKEQIAEGKYPIDLEAITDSLFQSYRELAN